MKTISLLSLTILSVGLLTACGTKSDKKSENNDPSTPYKCVVKLKSKEMPLPLGRYVQLTSNELTVSATEPDADGNGKFYVDFPFEVLRHVPNLKYMNFKIESDESDFRVKFKKDQQAVEELSKAIAEKNVSKTTIRYSLPYNDVVSQEIKSYFENFAGGLAQIDYSTIYIEIPPSKIYFTGIDSNIINVTDRATVYLDSEEGSSSVTLSLDVNYCVRGDYKFDYSYAIAKIRTEKGDFEAYLNCALYSSGDGNHFINGDNVWISPRDMDQLLNYPLSLEIEFIQ